MIDKDYSIASLKSPSCVHFREKSFADTIKNATAAEYDESTQTATYYGLIPSNNNQTKILLYNSDGVGYSRKYNKVMKGGESIVLNGPNSSEGNLWTKHTLVKNIMLNESRISTYIDETPDLVATIEPLDAENGELEWTSSNTDVATVDNSGHVKVVGEGEALITVATKDGTRNTCCGIKSYYHAYVDFDNVLSSQGSGVLDAKFRCKTYDVPIHLKQIYMYEYTTNKEYLLYTVPEEKEDQWDHSVTLNFSNLPTGYYKLKAIYECNGKTYTIYSQYAATIN